MSDFFQYTLIILLNVGLVFVHGVGYGERTMETQAIERGYAIYCLGDSKFAWLGECAETKE